VDRKKAPQAWVTARGELVAVSLADLTDGTLQNPIDGQEDGTATPQRCAPLQDAIDNSG